MTRKVWRNGPEINPKSRLINQITKSMTAINQSNLNMIPPFYYY